MMVPTHIISFRVPIPHRSRVIDTTSELRRTISELLYSKTGYAIEMRCDMCGNTTLIGSHKEGELITDQELLFTEECIRRYAIESVRHNAVCMARGDKL